MTVKELISLVYAYDATACDELSGFTKRNGFALREFNSFEKAIADSKTAVPDLIIFEWGHDRDEVALNRTLNDLSSTDFQFRPAVFVSVDAYPERQSRNAWMKKGVDALLVRPFDVEEVRSIARTRLDLKSVCQEAGVQKQQLSKTRQYLDRFKNELKETKSELLEERISLNNALKQVNHMTKERSRLKQEIKQLQSALLKDTEGFEEVLSHLIRTRVETNRGHADRVAHISDFIGRQLKFDEKLLEDLRKAAMLHEVGHLLTPEETLKKETGQLTGYEADFFVQYPVKGADLLAKFTEFEKSAEIIRHLNENSDGTGNPEGLKRRYIPLVSRILAGADVFDSLKNDAAITSLEIFLERLEMYSGTRLDPNIVAWLEKYAVLHMGSDDYHVKGIGIHQLEPGMTLGTALFTHTGTKLFSVNTLLTQDAIDKIRKYNREYPVDETVYIRA